MKYTDQHLCHYPNTLLTFLSGRETTISVSIEACVEHDITRNQVVAPQTDIVAAEFVDGCSRAMAFFAVKKMYG